MRQNLLTFALTFVLAAMATAQTPLGNSFTYQFRLDSSGIPVNDVADFEFSLWDAETGGTQIGRTVLAGGDVVDGLFTTELNFGPDVFNGEARWLEVSVQSPPGSAFVTLTPRQPVTATPYALQTRGIDVDQQGTVTANAFVGDGSGLTNLPAMAGAWAESGNDVYYTAGNVGVGTDTPAAALDVIGDIHANGGVFVLGTTQLDQSSESVSAYAINYGIWQSFTAGLSGPLTTVSIRLNELGTATSATLTVYEGVGTGGTVVSQGEVSLPTGVTAWVDLPVVAMPSVQAGQQYTFEVAANDTAYIGIGRADPYPGGQSNLGTNDVAFRTYVRPGGTVTAGAFIGDGSGLTNLPVMAGVWNEAGNDVYYTAGNVGIGTDTPAVPLDVIGDIRTNGSLSVLGTTELDQSSEINDSTLPSFGFWQAFTAGVDGALTTVSIWDSGMGSATSGILVIYEGVGTVGTIISHGNVNLGGPGWVDMPVAAMPSLQAGQQYTFRLLLFGSLDIGVGTGDPYAGGLANLPYEADATFRTYVRPGGTVTANAFVGDGSGLTNLPVTAGVWNESGNDMFYNDGNVGIGTDTPTAPLHVLGGNQTPLSHLRVEVDGTAPFGSILSLDAEATDGGKEYLIFSSGASAAEGQGKLVFKNQTNNRVLMTLDPSGPVGIGTRFPTRGMVDIEGFVSRALGLHGYLNGNGLTGLNAGADPANYSLYASHRIAASSFNAHSDARIKSIVGLSDNNADLSTLLAIEVTDYTMLDKVTNGDQPYKKVIGQQLRDVFPQAVTLSPDVVPDIYQPASVEDGWIALTTDLDVGDRVRLITDDGASVHEVLEVRADRFRVAKSLEGRIFVYGREVDDFHNVDYEAIAMLNVSATQALYQQMKTLESEKNTEIAELKNRLERLEALLEASAQR